MSESIVWDGLEQVRDLAGRAATATPDSVVLLLGGRGCGKEVVARYIHSRSDRKDREMIKTILATKSDDLAASEMFGHAQGSFTGAVRDRKGRFEEAEHSTIFLDEIGDLSDSLQVQLLRVLE